MSAFGADKGACVWWTSGEDCERIDTIIQSGVRLPAWPRYLIELYERRLREDGPEPVVAADEFGEFTVAWTVGSPEHLMVAGAKGIVIRPEDIPLVIVYPGFVTDLRLNFLSRVPERQAGAAHPVAA